MKTGGPYYDSQTMEDTAQKTQHVKKAMEGLANLQRGLENCYEDVRTAINLDQRGEGNTQVLTRVERTLANVLTILSLCDHVSK